MKVIYLSTLLVIIDQATKLWIKGFKIPFLNIIHEGMYHGESIPVIGDFFRITFIENPGMAFGFDPGLDFKLLVSLFSLIASIALVYYLYMIRHKALSLRIAIAFILGGAAGNLIDRMFYGIFYGYSKLFYGYVVDFLSFDFFDVQIFGRGYDRFPIFNIADSAVTIGVVILLLFYKSYSHETIEAAVDTDAVIAADNQIMPETTSGENGAEPDGGTDNGKEA